MKGNDSARPQTAHEVEPVRREVCCSSPSAICYWCAVSLVAWGALSLIGIYWHPLRGSSAATILLAAGIGCVANWFKNRTLHCAITAPVFLVGGAVFILANLNLVHIEARLAWACIAIGTGIAFLLEWRYARRPAG